MVYSLRRELDCCGTSSGVTGRVLIVGDLTWHSDASPTRGVCRLEVDGAQIGDTAFPGELSDVTDDTHVVVKLKK